MNEQKTKILSALCQDSTSMRNPTMHTPEEVSELVGFEVTDDIMSELMATGFCTWSIFAGRYGLSDRGRAWLAARH